MSVYAPGCFSGNYLMQGDPETADCIIGNEFGHRKVGYGAVNAALAYYIDRECPAGLPKFIHRNIAGALRDMNPGVAIDEEFEGDSASYSGLKGMGTWGELSKARQEMDERGLNRPLIVAQAYHVGRVANLARMWGMEPIVPHGLPRQFDPESDQKWTRSQEKWVRRESWGALALYGVIGLSKMDIGPYRHAKLA